jgi:predicted membrane-bound spermidine synthase
MTTIHAGGKCSSPGAETGDVEVIRLAAGIGLVTLSALMFEITVTRIFSVTLLYHFSTFAISMALLGITASGVVASALAHRLRAALDSSLTLLGCLHALALAGVGALLLVVRVPGLNLYAGLTPPLRLYLLIIAVLTALPFFLSGLIVVLCLSHRAAQASTLYFADLVGAGGGAFLVPPVLDWVGAPGAILVIAFFAALAAVVFSLPKAGRYSIGSAAVLVLLLALLGVHLRYGLLELQVVKGVTEGANIFEKWNAFSRITVTPRSDSVYNISIDAGAATSISTPEVIRNAMADPNASMSQAVYRLKASARVLVIGPGGGNDVASARYFGHHQVTGVEINPIIVSLVRERFKSFTGDLYGQDGVHIVHDDGRSFVRGSHEHYDIIQLSMVDTWAATGAGWLALTENTLYTVEAFEDYLRHLSKAGTVSVQRWFFPEMPRETLRVVSLGAEALRRQGSREPGRHILVWRMTVPVALEGALPFTGQVVPQEVSMGTVLIKRTPFDEAEIERIEGFCREAPQCMMVYAPGRQISNPFTTLLHAQDPASFYKTYPLWVDPTTDNRPFFFYTLKPSQALTTFSRDFFRVLSPDVANMGLFLLINSALITAGLVLLAIVLPLVLLGRRQNRRGWGPRIGYFFCLGLGFMLVEISMLQRLTLLLSYPVYSLAVTLASLLVFSGCGSLLAGRLGSGAQRWRPAWTFGGLAGLGALYAWLLPALSGWALPLSLPVRVVLAVLLLLPVGLLLGLPFPLGIKRLGLEQARLIPWAWASNGGASVLGSSLAMLIALHWGFTAVLLVGTSCYLLAWLLFHRWTPAE